MLLAAGSLVLPASPRWLVLKGRRDAAELSLAKLRLRKASEVGSDPLVQVSPLRQLAILTIVTHGGPFQIELLEMQVETELIQRTARDAGKDGKAPFLGEWTRLFSRPLRARTLIGIMIMFFQRTHFLHSTLVRKTNLVLQNGVVSTHYYTMGQPWFKASASRVTWSLWSCPVELELSNFWR